jgi:predicted RND superfamily exporter protein
LWKWATTDPIGLALNSQNFLGFKDKKLIYMKITAISIGNPLWPYDKKNPIYERWEAYMQAYRDKAPASMKSVEQTAGQYWAFMVSEKAFLSSAFQGMAISGGFAFGILLLATGNIIQAIVSLICVAVVIISVLAIMQLQGWEIGVSESIAMVILIGFSVDYVVHLAADFSHSMRKTRGDKMKQAYTEMGISILSGAITTLGSGVFLFGGKIIFFNKFAVLITSTISISFAVAMVLFGAIMHVLGPEDGAGDLRNLCRKPKIEKEGK